MAALLLGPLRKLGMWLLAAGAVLGAGLIALGRVMARARQEGRIEEREIQRKVADETRQRMQDADAHGPRDRDGAVDRLSDGRF
jgi:hypothetical protein